MHFYFNEQNANANVTYQSSLPREKNRRNFPQTTEIEDNNNVMNDNLGLQVTLYLSFTTNTALERTCITISKQEKIRQLLLLHLKSEVKK
jgi:hypothetical protein